MAGEARLGLRPARAGRDRLSQPDRPVQHTQGRSDVMGSRAAYRTGFFREDAAGAAGQRSDPDRTEPAEDRPHPSVGEGRAACAGGQALDYQIRRHAEAGERSERSGGGGAGGVRHHDRALRDHVDPAAGTGERRGGVRAARTGQRCGTGHQGEKRALSDESCGGCSAAPSGVVFRYRRNRRRLGGRGYACGRPGAMDGFSRRETGLRDGCSRAKR